MFTFLMYALISSIINSSAQIITTVKRRMYWLSKTDVSKMSDVKNSFFITSRVPTVFHSCHTLSSCQTLTCSCVQRCWHSCHTLNGWGWPAVNPSWFTITSCHIYSCSTLTNCQSQLFYLDRLSITVVPLRPAVQLVHNNHGGHIQLFHSNRSS